MRSWASHVSKCVDACRTFRCFFIPPVTSVCSQCFFLVLSGLTSGAIYTRTRVENYMEDLQRIPHPATELPIACVKQKGEKKHN